MQVAIIKYNAGNVQSVTYALQRLGITPILTDNEEEIRKADRVIFPGVGEASTAMSYLHERKLDQLIPSLQQPVLGICLGLQLMCSQSEENNTKCLGIFDLQVKKFSTETTTVQGVDEVIKIPHMGWNAISQYKGRLLQGLPDQSFVYYVHSYYAELGDYTAATTDYVQSFSAVLQRNNFYATQFHPEKSGETGSQLLENFLNLN
jgi:glutamine amidotransferase